MATDASAATDRKTLEGLIGFILSPDPKASETADAILHCVREANAGPYPLRAITAPLQMMDQRMIGSEKPAGR